MYKTIYPTHVIREDVITFYSIWLRLDAIYEKVDEARYADVAMTTSPAYEGVTIK